MNHLETLLLEPERIRKTVCITFCGRSGSYLLTNLLADHPQVIAAPPHSLFTIAHQLAALRSGGVDELLTQLEQACYYLFDDADHTPHLGKYQDRMRVGVPRQRFMQVLRHAVQSMVINRGGNITQRNLFNAIHISYAICAGHIVNVSDPVIVWQRHVPLPVNERSLVNRMLGPDVVFLACVRRPEPSLSSHLEHHLNEKPMRPIAQLFLQMLGSFLMAASRAPRELGLQEHAVRFEDLHARTEVTMRSVANLLGIEFLPILLATTMDKQTFYFPKKDTFVTGLNPNVEKTQTAPWLPGLDGMMFRHALRGAYAAWKYRGNARSITQFLDEHPKIANQMMARSRKIERECFRRGLLEFEAEHFSAYPSGSASVSVPKIYRLMLEEMRKYHRRILNETRTVMGKFQQMGADDYLPLLDRDLAVRV